MNSSEMKDVCFYKPNSTGELFRIPKRMIVTKLKNLPLKPNNSKWTKTKKNSTGELSSTSTSTYFPFPCHKTTTV